MNRWGIVRSLNFVVGITLLTSYPLVGEEKTDSDQAKMQGKWAVKSAISEGKEQPEATDVKFEIKGDKMIIRPKDKPEQQTTFKLDSSKNPKQIDVTFMAGQAAVALGIYEISKDGLRLTLAKPGIEKRPTEFKSESKEVIVIHLVVEK